MSAQTFEQPVRIRVWGNGRGRLPLINMCICVHTHCSVNMGLAELYAGVVWTVEKPGARVVWVRECKQAID